MKLEVLHPQAVSTMQRVTLWCSAVWLLPILLLSAGVRIYGLTQSDIWCDEGSSLLMSQYSPEGIWFHAAHDVHPPLYYLILHAWMNVWGNGIFSIRVLSVLPGVGTVVLAMWLMSLIATRRATVLAGVLLALLPIAVRYSQEVRMYSLLGFLLIGATLALVYWVRQPERKHYLVIYALLMAAGFYTHYFTALCVLAHWFYLLTVRSQTPEKSRLVLRASWWITNVAIVVMFLPWISNLVDLLEHMDELRVGGDVGWIAAVTWNSLPSTLWQFLTLEDQETLAWPVFWLVPLLLIAVAVVVAVRDRSPHRFHVLLVAYTFVPLAVILLISIWVPRLAIAVLVVFLGVEAVGLKNDYSVDGDQFHKMVDYVNQHYAPGDRIVISDLFWYFPYVYYSTTTPQPLLYTPPLPNGKSGRPNEYGFGTLVAHDADKLYVDSLSQLPKAHGRVWLVSSSGLPDDFTSIPDNWVKQAEVKVGDTQASLYSTPALD